jgi:hypothetical protein
MSDISAPAPTKIKNVTGRDHCAACIDGWVELAGTVTIGDQTYTRGMAPCKWCELGLARWTRHPELAQDFDGSDIVPPGVPGRRCSPPAELLERFRAIAPPVAEPESPAEVERKRRIAIAALEHAPQADASAPRADERSPQHVPIPDDSPI